MTTILTQGVIAGDLIDRGQDSDGNPTTAKVLDMIIDENTRSIAAGHGQKIYAVKGNHEELFLNAMAEIQRNDSSDEATECFLYNGGDWLFADSIIRNECLSIIQNYRTIKEPTDDDTALYLAFMKPYLNQIKEAYRLQYTDPTSTTPHTLIDKLTIYQQYMTDLPCILKVNDIDPLLVGHSQIALTDRAINEKCDSNKLTLTNQEKQSLLWTRPDKFSRLYRTEKSIPVFCGHNILQLDASDEDGDEPVIPVREDTNHINLDGGAYLTKNILLVNFTQKTVDVIPGRGSVQNPTLVYHANEIQDHLKNTPFARLIFAIQKQPTPQKIDDALIRFINRQENVEHKTVKEKKELYLNALKHLCDPLNPKITVECQQQLALYLLKKPAHLLKKERDLFRFTHSNETDSMHQMIKMLLPATAYQTRLNGVLFTKAIDIEEDNVVIETISRHGSKHWP